MGILIETSNQIANQGGAIGIGYIQKCARSHVFACKRFRWTNRKAAIARTAVSTTTTAATATTTIPRIQWKCRVNYIFYDSLCHCVSTYCDLCSNATKNNVFKRFSVQQLVRWSMCLPLILYEYFFLEFPSSLCVFCCKTETILCVCYCVWTIY